MKKMIRIPSFIISIILGTSTILSSCATKTTEENKKPIEEKVEKSSEVSEVEVADDTKNPYGKYPEPITITTAKILNSNAHFPEGKTSSNNIMTDEILKQLNIKVEILWEAEDSQYNNKLSLSIASGDIPDMTYIKPQDYSTFMSLAENDMLEDLSGVYKDYQGEYMKEVLNSYGPNVQEATTIDGKLLGLTVGTVGYQHDLLWVRNDWLKQLNLPLPKTLEDIENIAKAFVEQDPGKSGKGQNVGLALNALIPVGAGEQMYGADPIFQMYGAYPQRWITGADGKVYWGSVAPEMKEGLQKLQDMYAGGLIDKSFMTRTHDGETNALVTGGLCGIYFSPWWDPYASTTELSKNNPDAELVAVQAPLDNNGKFNHTSPSSASTFLAVRKGYEYPEAIFKMLNVEFDIWRGFNTEAAPELKKYLDAGTSWEAIFPTSGLNLEYYDAVPKVGVKATDYIENGKIDKTVSPTNPGQWITLVEQAKSYIDNPDPVNQPGNMIEYYARYIGANKTKTEIDNVIDPAYFFNTLSTADIKPNLDKLENEMILQIIVGEKPVSYFDEFVVQWNKLGGETLTKEVQEAIDAR